MFAAAQCRTNRDLAGCIHAGEEVFSWLCAAETDGAKDYVYPCLWALICRWRVHREWLMLWLDWAALEAKVNTILNGQKKGSPIQIQEKVLISSRPIPLYLNLKLKKKKKFLYGQSRISKLWSSSGDTLAWFFWGKEQKNCHQICSAVRK